MIALTAAKAILSRIPLPVWTAVGAALVMAIPLGVQTVRYEVAESQRADLYRQINDEQTGFIARLAVCRGNTATLEAAIAGQNAAVMAMADQASERIARAEEAASQARSERDEAEARAARFMARPIQGATLVDRVLDVDAAVLADLEGQER